MDTFESVKAKVAQLTQQQIVETAKRENARIMSTPRVPLNFVRHVDGVKDAPEELVKPGGVIVYDYGRLDEVAYFALDTLRQLSPIDEGDYVRSHVLMLNDLPVEDLRTWKTGDKISISNSQPYTRKIEIGKNGYRRSGHVYEKAEQIVARRFGNIASVYFTYDRAPPGDIHKWAATTKLHRAGRASLRAEWLVRQPTIVIREFH